MSLPLIIPDWPAPANVRAAISTREGGLSLAPYDSLNLGGHVNDAPAAVAANRERLAGEVGLPVDALGWINQVHSDRVVALPGGAGKQADASVAHERYRACAILTADCLPVLFCSSSESIVAAAHAGWRGLAAGVLENTLATFSNPSTVMVWLGPAIGPDAFEVGSEVREAFLGRHREAGQAFKPSPKRENHYLADIYELARIRIAAAGVHPENIHGGGFCTVSDGARFFSYRRDGETGRMASLIWME
ncbi:purine nucleoside phosphorylase YfiH [Marinobacter nanhaiticus D15-8W]|uniref:peptidoglycan editing factor PgeF n=1 Tax=Marinobacter nanhaiticus TaxID=1305740 RepID=UPI0002CCCBEF|nr:purine nucleoside phosphorylase YfiH [Marinobacter nanhaiticus D15-8W]